MVSKTDPLAELNDLLKLVTMQFDLLDLLNDVGDAGVSTADVSLDA